MVWGCLGFFGKPLGFSGNCVLCVWKTFVFKTFGFSQHPVKFSLKIELEYDLLKGNFV